MGTFLTCNWRVCSHLQQLLALVRDKEETQIQDLPLCFRQHGRYHAAVMEEFENSSCDRSASIQSATNTRVSPPGFLPVSNYLLLINPGPPQPQAKRCRADFQEIEVAFPVEQVCGSAGPQGIRWCTQDGARKHPGRRPSPSVIPGSHRGATHWPSQDTEGTGRSEHPPEHGVSTVSWPTSWLC